MASWNVHVGWERYDNLFVSKQMILRIYLFLSLAPVLDLSVQAAAWGS